MTIALFGATGGTGRQVLEQALEQGHQVRALARDPAKLPADRPGLTVIAGDVLDPTAVADCLRGSEAVICTLGTRGGEPVEARGTRTIIGAMQAEGVRRLIAVTSMGVGDSADQMSAVFLALMKLTLKKVMAAKEEQEDLIRASGLDWTIVRPGGLTDGPRTGTYLAGLDKSIRARRVARADVAEFVLKQLTDTQFVHRTPAIS